MAGALDLKAIGSKAKKAFTQTSGASTEQKNRALEKLCENLIKSKATILAANSKDLQTAKAAGMEEAMLDRLSLQGRLEGIAEETRRLIALPDPVGTAYDRRTLPNGLKLHKVRTPLGVLGVIYEARPNVTLDVAGLTIKTGNCAILRGGSESIHSNRSLVDVIQQSLEEAGLPKDTIQFIDSPDRSLVKRMLELHESIDLIIPRGGASLHAYCRDNTRIPVITGGIGICHLFADKTCKQDKALEVIHNAKTQRPTVCNALGTLLVHRDVSEAFIPKVLKKLQRGGVSFRLDKRSFDIASKMPEEIRKSCVPAESSDWSTEWLSLVLGIAVVDGLEEAIAHIRRYSSGHSDGILTEDKKLADEFVRSIDSAAVYVNASTRFTDGGEFGLGAEVAISTQKIHARGPMGLEELTSYKWVIVGSYQVRA